MCGSSRSCANPEAACGQNTERYCYLVKLGVAECAGKFVLEAKEAAQIIVRHIGQSIVVSGRWQADKPRAIILNVAVIKCMQAADHR